MSARKGQRARHDALDYRIDGTRELRPKSLASFFVPAPSLKDFILCFRSENNTSGHSLANNFRRTSDQGTTLSGVFSWSAHRRSSSARCSGLNASSPSRSSSDRLSHNAIARSARSPGGSLNSCAPTTPSPGRPDRRAGASTVARVRWIPWRDSLMQHPLRQAGAMCHGNALVFGYASGLEEPHCATQKFFVGNHA